MTEGIEKPVPRYQKSALAPRILHGHAIIEAVEELTGGRKTLLPGSPYTTPARMVEEALLEGSGAPSGEKSGGAR